MPLVAYRLPSTIFRYVVTVSWPHQIALVSLTVITFLLEVAPLEIQRRVVNNLVKDRPFQLVVTLCADYARRRSCSGRDQARPERLSKLGRRKCDAGSAPTRPRLFEDRSIPQARATGARRRSRHDRR
jgi:hypothetical protein